MSEAGKAQGRPEVQIPDLELLEAELSRSRQSIADYIAKINEQKQLRSGSTDLMALRDQLKKKKGYEG